MTQAALDLTGTWDLDPAHTRLGFAVRHAMVATVRGNFGIFSGVLHLDHAEPGKSSAEVEVDATSINTGNQQRDDHLRSPDFLDVAKYPKVTFRSTSAEAGGEPDSYILHGELTIRDTTRPVTFEFDLLGSSPDPYGNVRAGFEGKTTINRKDWGLTWNHAIEAGGVMVGEKVKIELDVEAVKRAES
jgi:polyisoprenoid-binding protein YceI